jgi:predicted MFS family arabinose efflux permease
MANASDTLAVTRPQALNAGALFNLFVIGLTAFLTVVDLFATQALLPTLATHYGATPAQMGVAVNATTIGMAISGIAVALFSRSIPRRFAIMASLTILAIPTSLLAVAPDLTTFALLRVAQGLCMCAAFTLTLAHLGERCSASASPAAFSAYVTGNVASNLIGRLLAAGVVDHFGLASSFHFFAALNLAGAILVSLTISRAPPQPHLMDQRPSTAALIAHLRNRQLRAAFGIGFLILFVFIGTFTYVNFVLARPPLGLGMMALGLVYFVFAPSILTTPAAGAIVSRIGSRAAIWLGLALAGIGLPLLLAPALLSVLAGMVLVAIGTFFAQATATGFVSRTATTDRGAASGLYLASYFAGGMAGAALLGQLFDRFGWGACVAGIGAGLLLAATLAVALKPRAAL